MDYIYAVSRVRCQELSLLSASVMEQLVSSRTYEECLAILSEKGWGELGENDDEKTMLDEQRKKTWAFISEIAEDMRIFDVFFMENDFHNLKTAIKMKYSSSKAQNAFIEQVTIPIERIRKAIDSSEYTLLPENMQQAAKEASEAIGAMNEPQLCDIIVDKACLKAIYETSKKIDNEVLSYYSEALVAMSNIKTAVRACRAGKSQSFIKQALVPCDSLDIERLSIAAAKGIEEIANYLKLTNYSKIAQELSEGISECEKMLDDMLIEHIKPQKYVTEGPGPLFAYILARENEIKNVRLILSGKKNDLDEGVLRERLRQMYV